MVMACLILVFSTALFFFYCQVTIQKILRRAFDHAYFQVLATANRLEFPALRKAFEEVDPSVDYARIRMNIKCDFLAVTYLLKNASNFRQGYSREERLLMLYFRLVLVSLTVRHWLRLREKPAVMALTAILQYFANVVGARMNSLRFGDPSFSNYVLSL
jgi:hypothetical protein